MEKLWGWIGFGGDVMCAKMRGKKEDEKKSLDKKMCYVVFLCNTVVVLILGLHTRLEQALNV